MSLHGKVYNLIKALFLLVDDGDSRFIDQFNLTVPRYYALVHIAENPGISPVQLSECLLCDKSNITRILKGLESDNLSWRRPHEHDGRSVRLFLTDEGQTLCRRVKQAHDEFNQRRFAFVDEFPPEQLGVLQTIHDELLAELNGLDEQAGLGLTRVQGVS